MSRRVVLVCGPPGSGKTTYAHSLGIDVYDIDDAKWGNSERLFVIGLARLGQDRNAQAAVIRSGATRSARGKAALLVGATEIVVLDVEPKVCIERVVARARPRPSLRVQIAAIKTWHERYEPELASEDW